VEKYQDYRMGVVMVDFKALLIALSPLIFIGFFLGMPIWMFWRFNNPWGLYIILGIMGFFLVLLLAIMIMGLYFDLQTNGKGGVE